MSRAIERYLTRHDIARYLALLAVLVCAPALALGWVADDLVHQMSILGLDEFPESKRSPLDLFRFAVGDLEENRRAIDAFWPWWTAEDLRLNFLRPVTGLTHGIDYALWPRSPVLMHAHALLWRAGAVGAAPRLYRRLLPSPAVAGLAALFFALDEVHGMAATWVANRNAAIAVVCVLLALLAYDRLRRDGWRPGIVWTPILVLLGVLANEGAVAAGAYLLAYAICLDRGSWKERLLPLVPTAAVGVLWATAYKLFGYGAVGSGVYIDPGTTPARFVEAAVERAPALLRGLLAWPPADLDLMLARPAQPLGWWLSLGVAMLFAALFWLYLRRDPRARFFALGMTLSLVPACSTFPSNRLLFIASIGGLGLIAQLLAGLWETARGDRGWRLPAKALVAFLAVVHLVLAPLGILTGMIDMRRLGDVIEQAASSLPADEQVRGQRVVIVNTPTAFVSTYGPVVRALRGEPVPARTLIMGSSLYSIAVERRGERILAVRPEGGFLPPPGTPRPGDDSAPAVFPGYVFQTLDHLYRDLQADPLELGERIELTDLTIEVTGALEGRPSEVSFRFARPLEDPALRWLRWNDGVYVPFELPADGETVVLEPARIRLTAGW